MAEKRVMITDDQLGIFVANGTVRVTVRAAQLEDNAVTLPLDENGVILDVDRLPESATRYIIVTPPETIERSYLERLVVEVVKGKERANIMPAIPLNHRPYVEEFWVAIQPILTLLGARLKSQASGSGKAQHRFNPKIAGIAFTTEHAGTRATIHWRKRNEIVIDEGAQMLSDPKPNANGELGFDARFALKLRDEQKDGFDSSTFVTTRDIVLRSMNEVGLFLYFGGTNSWLQFHDKNGRTIDDWSIVK